MRIVIASGHYPPNFVSGGSLQPQRLAKGLRARGHDVWVYAGHMDADRPALETWDEVDETGLPVHWVVTTPFEPWADDRNWDNPEVRRDFATFLDRVQPDIVHLHDLQMLGGSLAPAAKAHGARVVVTMHDMWWICARLFLVDHALRPCSFVVDAGTCACEVNRAWLADRTARLADSLDAVDVVFAPSASAVRVLEANGVAADRIEVDENGLPEADVVVADQRRDRHVRAANEPVRFGYAGGLHDLKGALELLRAAEALTRAGVGGWELTLFGVDEAQASRSRLALDTAAVRFRPSFAPHERDAKLGALDVLIVPSIMLETHSIITREALSRGIPVICTNRLGPEEVVEQGRNGLIVPAGDHAALADAMRSLTEDAALLARLQQGAETPVLIRRLSDQVEGLERHYQDLLDQPGAAERPRRVRTVLFACGIEGAPLRYRARLPAEALAEMGVASTVRHYRDPRLLRDVDDADLLYVYRVPATSQFLEVIQAARARGIPVVFDVDDLIFDPTIAAEIPALQILSPPEAEGWLYGVKRYRTTMEHCDGYVGSTAALVRHAREVTGLPAAQLDNGVGLLLARASDRARVRPRRLGPVRIGYLSGTITHDRDWFFVEPAVLQILERHPEVELWMVGHLPHSDALAKFGDRVKRIPFTRWLELPQVLRDIDVNIAPLEPGSRFNEAKSAIKWLEAALVATPTVASATEPFRDAIIQGVSGFLADDLDDWVAHLDHLVTDAHARTLIGQRAWREALLRWSPSMQGRRLLEIIEEAHAWPAMAAARQDPGWTPAIADEPFEPAVLEPYTTSRLAPARKAYELRRSATEWRADQLRSRVDRDGLLPTARRVPRALARMARASARRTADRVPMSRASERVAYTRRVLRERGFVASTTAAVRRGRRALLSLPGVRAVRSLTRRAARALRKHGARGTFELAVPVVLHRVHLGRRVVRSGVRQLSRRISSRR